MELSWGDQLWEERRCGARMSTHAHSCAPLLQLISAKLVHGHARLGQGGSEQPESRSNTHAESKELPLMGLELLKHSSVQQAQYRNENAAPREIQCA